MDEIFKERVGKFTQESKKNSLAIKLSTSLSDNQVYPDFCMKASIDLFVFSNFRRNRIYRQVLEHVSFYLGKEYLEEIPVSFLEKIELIKENDIWGNPKLCEYPSIGKISPTTLRYTKVLTDLLTLFKELDNLNICEIGVGYGGQCRVINSMSSPNKYTLVDIKPVLMLTQRYLDNYILNSPVCYKTMNELETKNYDLVISNYAFSELRRNIQDVYLNKIILNSKKGYITFNEITPEYFNSYKREELIDIIPNSRIIEEKPLTHSKNCIIIWGDN